MVLLYEPDPDVAALFCFLLESLGWTVQVATTHEDLLQLGAAPAPAFAVVRPEAGVDSWALCRQLQTRLGAPVIALLPPEATGEPAADLHVLPLPVDPAALRRVVQLLTTTIRT